MTPVHTEVEVAGETVWLLPARAVFWPARRWLWVADLHWGKDAAFRAAGIPLPPGLLDDDLARLTGLVAALDPGRLLILGDLVHARSSLHPMVIEAVAEWRTRHPLRVTLIEGNHDRHAPHLPAAWAIERGAHERREGPFVFRHVPAAVAGGYVWAGHLHPAVVLGRGQGRLRLPCFHLGPSGAVLPAFSSFTDGAPLREPGCRYAIAGDEIVRVP